ncbi:HD-GYP domain-containing protein [Tautonia sociabilis]|uniref:HD-GYP domain-containing protein n=1 Tax=Tautonia sociabilis TaxID=2080755 RepID=A0A432MKU7_9BACT|nr:HD-GYP domain-containing protein [Tautonia sociabilis]RUL88031.1 HD-GYP domain-containing protein [Tautonia sociabilis]
MTVGEPPPRDQAEHRARCRARALSLEFSAPVGLLEIGPGGEASWAARVGEDEVRWPRSERAASAVRESGGKAVSLWIPGPAENHLWLIVRCPDEGGASTTAWAGFALSGTGHWGVGRPWGPWGTPAPAPALLAWGREIHARLAGSPSGGSGPGDSEAPARRRLKLPDRLTRELSVSDPPERFQRLAVEALRGALQAEAVAWVPRSRREPVVQSGSISGRGPETFRQLLPRPDRQGDHSWSDPNSATVAGVRHALAVAADPEGGAGWLVAVNPLDDRPFGQDEADLLRPIASLIAAQRTNSRHYAELKDLLFGVIRSLSAAIDAKDPYTLGHSERVGRIAAQLGEAMGLSANERGDLYLCGLLHDVGKIGISDAILQKAGPLTPSEFGEIKRHVRIGVQILSDLKKLNHLLPGVAHHHENFDGSGYPDGLAGASIPKIARILAVADAFDAMSSTRPYRRRLSPDQIDRIFRDGAGTQWDPEVVSALFTCRQQVERIRQKGLGDSVMQVVDDTIGRAEGASILSSSTHAAVDAG